jgi:hypothetical protein
MTLSTEGQARDVWASRCRGNREAGADVRPAQLRELGIYIGSQGIFFDKARAAATRAG